VLCCQRCCNEPTPIQSGPSEKCKRIMSSRSIRSNNSNINSHLLFIYSFTFVLAEQHDIQLQGQHKYSTGKQQTRLKSVIKKKIENKPLQFISYKD